MERMVVGAGVKTASVGCGLFGVLAACLRPSSASSTRRTAQGSSARGERDQLGAAVETFCRPERRHHDDTRQTRHTSHRRSR